MTRAAVLIARAGFGLALLLAAVWPWAAHAQRTINNWQELAVYVGEQTTKLNAMDAQIKALQAENATLKAQHAEAMAAYQSIQAWANEARPLVDGALLNYTHLDADLSMQAGQINRLIRYAAFQMCAANAKMSALQGVFPWWQPFQLGANECPVPTAESPLVLPTYLRDWKGVIYGIPALP